LNRNPSSTSALVLLLAAGAWLYAGGCLNPRPEELPSSSPAGETPGSGVDFGIGGPGGASAEGPERPADGFENDDPVPPAPDAMPPSTQGGGNSAADAGAPDAAPEPDPEVVEAPE
jgi:hypothetical protein